MGKDAPIHQDKKDLHRQQIKNRNEESFLKFACFFPDTYR